MLNKLIVTAALAIVLLSATMTMTVQAKQPKPNSSSGDHKLIAIVKFDSDCWNEIYARATPKNNNHDLLNKQTVFNNDKPDQGPSEIVKLSWKFKSKVVTNTASTNEGKIRYYVEIELADGSDGLTLTQYKTFSAKNKELQFDTFNMKTNPELCQSLMESQH